MEGPGRHGRTGAPGGRVCRAGRRGETAPGSVGDRREGYGMQRIVVAAKAGADQPWLADAAAGLAEETGARVAVVSFDALELEALSTVPRDELAKAAEQAAT